MPAAGAARRLQASRPKGAEPGTALAWQCTGSAPVAFLLVVHSCLLDSQVMHDFPQLLMHSFSWSFPLSSMQLPRKSLPGSWQGTPAPTYLLCWQSQSVARNSKKYACLAHAIWAPEPHACESLGREPEGPLETCDSAWSCRDPTAAITIYHIGKEGVDKEHWWDLCAGPHVDTTKDINPAAIDLETVAGEDRILPAGCRHRCKPLCS